MLTPDSIAAMVLQVVAALAAGYGAWLCIRLQRYGSDRRLLALAWFFGLFAASVLLHAVWEYQVGELVAQQQRQPFFVAIPPGGGPPVFFRPQGNENVDLWLVGHHLLMLASLAVGVLAFGRRRSPQAMATGAAAVSLAWFSDLVPLMLALEAALTLYLAVQALLNHIERRSPGALQVAAGFALFFLGHLLYFTNHDPGRGRQGIGDILTLVGIILLVQVLPPAPHDLAADEPQRPTAAPPAAPPEPSDAEV